MNILIISKELDGADLALRLKNEGHAVRVFVSDKDQRQNLDGMIEKVANWKKNLHWVGKDGLIVFDCSGLGKEQDRLRKKGYSVVGGNYWSDRLENERQYGQKIFSLCGMKIAPSEHFSNIKDAIEFIRKNPDRWVIKQNGHASKSFNYIGELASGEDVIQVLLNYGKNNPKDCISIDLQKRIMGVEIGVGRYFNGHDWIGPIEINVEHKNLFDNDLGPKTSEMGTLMWYEENEKIRLYQETLAKFKRYLQKINFKGDFEINCIANENGLFPLEATPRFGYPSTQLQTEIHLSPWGDFLKALADGKKYELQYKKGFAIIVLLATSPFPYEISSKKYHPDGMGIFFKDNFHPKKDMPHIHLEEVSLHPDGQYYISSKKGYIAHISGTGKTIRQARKNAYAIVEKIIIPKVFYRTDIGEKFEKENMKKLKKWGWL